MNRFTAVKREKFAEGGVYYVAAFFVLAKEKLKWQLLYMPEHYSSPQEVKAKYPDHFEFLTEEEAKKFLAGEEEYDE